VAVAILGEWGGGQEEKRKNTFPNRIQRARKNRRRLRPILQGLVDRRAIKNPAREEVAKKKRGSVYARGDETNAGDM